MASVAPKEQLPIGPSSAEADGVACADLYESLDEDARKELWLKLRYEKQEPYCETVLGILAQKLRLAPEEVRAHVGQSEGDRFLEDARVTAAPEFDTRHEVCDARYLESALDALAREVGLTQEDILTGYWDARSPLVGEHHKAVHFHEPTGCHGFGGGDWEEKSSSFMKFDCDTGELFVWGDAWLRSKALSRRLVAFEDKEAHSKVMLKTSYDPDSYLPTDALLPKSITARRSVQRAGRSLEKEIRRAYDGYGEQRQSQTEFDVCIAAPVADGRVQRHYSALVDHQGNCRRLTFRFQRFVGDDTETPVEDISLERDDESIRLHIAKHEVDGENVKSRFKIDLEHPYSKSTFI